MRKPRYVSPESKVKAQRAADDPYCVRSIVFTALQDPSFSVFRSNMLSKTIADRIAASGYSDIKSALDCDPSSIGNIICKALKDDGLIGINSRYNYISSALYRAQQVQNPQVLKYTTGREKPPTQ